MTQIEQINFEQAVYDAFGQVKDFTLAMRIARYFYKKAEKDTIERACKWLFSHLPILVDYYNEDIHTNADRSEFIKLFRTQMEEEQ